MNRTEVSGVPAFWHVGPEPLTGGLTFGVGVRDESFRTVGVTHLVEHLVMGAIPRNHLDCNATVKPSWMEFYASGEPVAVVEFLQRVARIVGELPLTRLAVEAGVVEAEDSTVEHPTVCALLGLRYGARNLGLAAYVGPGPDQISADDVRAHAARYLVHGNTALWFTGPPPDGMRIDLPDGDRPARTEEVRRALPLPCWRPDDVPGIGLSFEGGRGIEDEMAANVLAERIIQRARHGAGLSYDLDMVPTTVNAELAHIAIRADARVGRSTDVAKELWSALVELGEDGPTEEELAHQVGSLRAYVGDPRSAANEASFAAAAHVCGTPRQATEQRLAAAAEVTGDQVRDTLRSARNSALLVVPDDKETHGLQLPGLPLGPECTAGEVTGRVLHPRLFGGPSLGMRLVTSDEGMTIRDADGPHTVRYDDCVGVAAADGVRVLIGGDGCVVPVIARHWRDGDSALHAVDAAVPRHLYFEHKEAD